MRLHRGHVGGRLLLRHEIIDVETVDHRRKHGVRRREAAEQERTTRFLTALPPDRGNARHIGLDALRQSDPALRPAKIHGACAAQGTERSEEHTSELQSLMRISYAVFCLKKTTTKPQ